MSLFKKQVLTNVELYVACLTKKSHLPYLIFVHGGPGLNTGIIEYLTEYEGFFKELNYNIILYDQRGCGRSKSNNSSLSFSHKTNIEDLHDLYTLLKIKNINIKGFIGHSYGAKLLYDFYMISALKLPSIFLSMSSSILTPRINNLLIDFAYLKSKQKEKYADIFGKVKQLSHTNIWQLSEEIAPLFQENPERLNYYWANMDCCALVQEVQKKLSLPINEQAFLSIRKELYSNSKNYLFSPEILGIPFLWINGFFDFIVNEQAKSFEQNTRQLFFQSAHYPHLEENKNFCEVLNGFLEKN